MSPHRSDRPARDEIEPGVPATSELPVDAPPGWDGDDEMPPADEPQGVDDWGTTAREEQLGEPLAIRRQREVPDLGGRGDAEGVRLYEPGAERGLGDVEADAIGEIDADRDDTLSAEEDAVHCTDEPDGLNYDPSPGYLDPEG